MGGQIASSGSLASVMNFHEMSVFAHDDLLVPMKQHFRRITFSTLMSTPMLLYRLPVAAVVFISSAFLIFLVRRFDWRRKNESERARRRRSSSFNEHESFPRYRNRSFSNDSWLKQSTRNRSWSNSFHRTSIHKRNSSFLMDESRRRVSLEQQSSMDVVRDSDVRLDEDALFWRALEDEEEERRHQAFREQANSRISTGNKEVPSQSPAKSFFCLLGPSVTTIEYTTMAPPPSWVKASRNLVLSDQTWDLSRVLTLELLSAPTVVSPPDFGNATLIVQKAKSKVLKPNQGHKPDKFVLKTSVSDCSVHVHGAPECGVLDIYEKGANLSERIEQTFITAAEAAQFQMDLLALQILGPLIYNMYIALRIVHQGSDVFTCTEPLLHHVGEASTNFCQESIPNEHKIAADRSMFVDESGIAWDDVMRCLGSSFPSIRIRLEAMRWLEVYGSFSGLPTSKKEKRVSSSSDESKGADLDSTINVDEQEHQPGYMMLNSLYSKRRRLLLGPVDFFRLFVPKLPETALPEDDCSRLRMERMLRLRKRVAQAAVLIQSYCRARTVVNLGWKISREVKFHESYWKRRFAFDDNIDNHQHDTSASNEYYEATVSRDIHCQVRGGSYLDQSSRFNRVKEYAATSLYQAYSLVGIHSFQWSGDEDGSPLHPKVDPVQSIVSLRNLISSNPSLDFFVVAIFLPSQATVIVHAYVRSLPAGIDPKFDNNIRRFVESDETVRKRKLEVSVQLEIDKEGLSFLERCLLIFLSFLLRFAVRRRIHTSNSVVSNDRTSLPSLNLSECGDTAHFGGFLQSDDSLPKNYVATNAYLHSRQNCNLVTRMMLSYIELGGLSRNVADITFVLAGELENELPERALCTSRTVCASLSRLPMSCVSISDNRGILEVDTSAPDTEDKGIASLMLKMFVTDPFVAAFESIIRSIAGAKRAPTHFPQNQMLIPDAAHTLCKVDQNSVNVAALDPFQTAINQLVSILEGISIPVAAKQINKYDVRQDFYTNNKVKELDQMPALNAFDRSDIVRFFIASNCNVKTASMRLVESAIWRRSTFPIDVRTCRVELQTGQFFHQGFDLLGNPVFYFRNYCLGPWRKDSEALIAAILHRLESTISQLARTNPFVQCTLIVLAGRPYRSKSKAKKELTSPNSSSSTKKGDQDDRHDQSTIASTAVSTLPGTEVEQQSNDDGATVVIEHDDVAGDATHSSSNNPRIFSDELWNMHTSKETIAQLVKVLLAHYPERLNTALVVIGHGNKKYARSVVGSMIYLTGLIASSRTRDKVRFLTRYRDLQSFVHRSQLITLAGGAQEVDSRHFECI